MPLSNRLCNATGEPAEIPWHAGIVIIVPPDAHVDLTVEQMDDFRGGKAGSEEVSNTMRHKGVFLYDSDRDYDMQALDTLRELYTAKNNQVRESVQTLRRERAAQGVTETEESFEEIMRAQGLAQLQDRVEKIKQRIKFFEGIVEGKEEKLATTNQLDPERTLFLKEGPPREFPSKASKALFKIEHPEMVAGDPADTEGEEDGSEATV